MSKMKLPHVIPHKQAKKLAGRYSPTFLQEFKDLRDLITPIHFDKFIPNAAPVIYFSAKEDIDHQYFLYCVFHRKDWSSNRGLIGHLDTHEYDLEGAMVVVDSWSEKAVMLASIFHNTILFDKAGSGRQTFHIEPEGHGITPWSDGVLFVSNHMNYENYGLVNINEPRVHKKFFGSWKREFNKSGVSTPDQWGYVSKMGVKSKGLIYTDPRKLFNMARKRKLL